MSQNSLTAIRTDALTPLIRNEPVQARSTARLASLLDAAAEVVAEIGYERLTTAMVADRAGASIGTVYRYFPDRIAVLQSLAARNAERFTETSLAAMADSAHTDWLAAMRAGFQVLVDAFRDEPGFASLRFGDVLDLRPAEGVPGLSTYADSVFQLLVGRFALDDSEAAHTAVEAVVVACDALTARAFARDAAGAAPFLERGIAATVALMAPFWTAPAR